MELEVRELPSFRLLCIRHIGPYHEIGAKFDTLMNFVRQQQISHGDTFGIYYDDPSSVPPEMLRSDAGVVVDADYDKPHMEMHYTQVKPGKYAVGVHVGSYEGLPQAWQAYMTAYEKAGYQCPPDGMCFERYIDDCETVPIEQVRTEICMPVV